MYFSAMKKGWEARLAMLGVSARQFCLDSDISYSTWKHMDNPSIGLCQKIEDAITKLEA
jgi:hypothetical protein